VEEKARDTGIPRLYRFTLDQESLYARMGWEVLGYAIGHERDCVIMAKDLRARSSA